jgi:Amino acid permease
MVNEQRAAVVSEATPLIAAAADEDDLPPDSSFISIHTQEQQEIHDQQESMILDFQEMERSSPNNNNSHSNPREHHRRSESTGSVLEDALEGLLEVKEAFVETVEEVVEEIQDVIAEEITPVYPREEGEHDQKLGALALSILVFYKVSGGPFGMEPTVRAGGPLVAILGFCVFPFVWSIPEALVTAELGSAFPEPSGAIAWVEEAFGAKTGLLCGYFHWISGATDSTLRLLYFFLFLCFEQK